MVIDACLYNGERDIFDIRYNILRDVVDEFVVVEFGHTFSGLVKEPHPINLPKVSYHFFTQEKDYHQPLPPAFAREYNQREMIKQCLSHLNDEDIVYMGDVDEIWEPTEDHLVDSKIRLRVYSYYLNNRSSEDFTLGPVCMRYKYLKDMSLNYLRSHMELTVLKHGWHFTSVGGAEALKKKIEAYGHQEFNTAQVKDNLVNVLEQNTDYIGRNFTLTVDESEHPDWLKKNRHKYLHLYK